ncbi:MAG: 1-deoxy-D-xylulose-5-phosphate synthase [Nitrospinae bacterium]|nr:1-deoxy-D-xylulose-5-phosphate synthase [Nitrospinota bacterium]
MSTLLERINNPDDLKQIPRYDLPKLAEEIREVIINTVSKTGGHLASNLGVVELTIAIHYVFNAPVDKIIWDVGHQTYTHKLLTGRRERFHTLRQYQGISGFPKRDESIYDTFNTGHSGTSISVALALAKSRDVRCEDNSVIAVIGDGSMTAGLAFEGLNNGGALNSDMIVILNDNEMSISPNVGALSVHLNRILTGQLFNKMRSEVEMIFKAIPRIGNQMVRFAERVEEAIKGIFVPGRLFEDLGFKYVGPIDGHNIPHLLDTFNSVKKLKGPILIHVVTKKGKGYPPAEKEADSFHGTPPFDIKTGNFIKKETPPSYTDIFSKTLVEIAREDERIIGITAAMADGTGLDRFATEFPHRFYDVGIAEQHAVTFAGGMALEGFKPVVAIYSTFLQRAYDQILHDVCIMNLPVTFAIDRAGLVGEDGPTHQGLFDISYLRSLPNMVVMAPKDENELRHMLRTALDYHGPAAVRYPRGSGVGVPIDKKLISIEMGIAEVLRDGKDVVILAIGNTVYPALESAVQLELDGINATVINARFIKPLDTDLIGKLAKKIGFIVTIEENVLQGGFGSAVLEYLSESGLTDVRVKRIGIPDEFVAHGSPQIIRKNYGLDEGGISRIIREVFESRPLRKMGVSSRPSREIPHNHFPDIR